MKHLFAYAAIALSLSVSPGLTGGVVDGASDGKCDDKAASATAAGKQDPDCPAVVLPEGGLPIGEATNLAFIAPIVGGLLALGALGGGSASSTTSTVSTN